MSAKEKIENKLRAGLKLSYLEVIDDSHLHAGHREARQATESHFRIVLKKDEVPQSSRIEKHRKIKDLIAELKIETLHALEIKLL